MIFVYRIWDLDNNWKLFLWEDKTTSINMIFDVKKNCLHRLILKDFILEKLIFILIIFLCFLPQHGDGQRNSYVHSKLVKYIDIENSFNLKKEHVVRY